MALGGDEVGDDRRVRRAADRAEDGERAEEREPGEHVVADDEEEERHDRVGRPAREDQRPAAVDVGEMAAEVAADGGERGTDEVGRPEAALARAELLDRPDAEERVGAAARQRAGELDEQNRAQGRIDVASPDEAGQTCERSHRLQA